MAYRQSEIGLTARIDPEAARRLLLAAFRESGADARLAAEYLLVNRRTFDRLVKLLGLSEKVEKLREAARRKAKRAA
jgi:hypothetical protein